MQLKTTDQTTFLIRLMCNIITILELANKREKSVHTRELGNNENIAQNNVKRKSNIERARAKSGEMREPAQEIL